MYMSLCHKILKLLHEIVSSYALFASNPKYADRWICLTVVFLPSAVVIFIKSPYLEELIETYSYFFKKFGVMIWIVNSGSRDHSVYKVVNTLQIVNYISRVPNIICHSLPYT
jgi:hypothetical protein